MAWNFGPKRTLRAGVLILICILVFITLERWERGETGPRPNTGDDQMALSNTQVKDVPEVPHYPPDLQYPTYCSPLNISNIAFITKTGATEARDKIPSQLSTSLRCVADPLIFSDLDQTLGPYQAHDVLSRSSLMATANNRDFDIYYKQKELASEGREDEIPALASMPISRADWRTKGKSAAWALDKYKFLHMIDRAWEYQPEKDWYVFIEADTYLSLANLVNFLSSKDPKEKLYFGNAVRMYEHDTLLYFAHGGSGFILSGATVRDFAVKHRGLATRFDWRIRNAWFGDFILADALDEGLHVQVTDVLPLLQATNPTDFPFADDNWCKPAISLHHMTAKETKLLFEYEKAHGFIPMLYRDLFDITFSGGMPEEADNWDNGSDDGKYAVEIEPNPDEKKAEDHNASFEACERACMQREQCLQFSFFTAADRTAACYLSKSIRWGRRIEKDTPEPSKSVRSGWCSEKIAKWLDSHKECPG